VPTQAPAHIADTCVGTQSPDDGAAVADFVIRCHESDLALSLDLDEDLAVQRLLVGLLPRRSLASTTVSKKPPPCSWSCRKTEAGYAVGLFMLSLPPDSACIGAAASPPARGSHRWRSRLG
jgi:hypothetical protein